MPCWSVPLRVTLSSWYCFIDAVFALFERKVSRLGFACSKRRQENFWVSRLQAFAGCSALFCLHGSNFLLQPVSPTRTSKISSMHGFPFGVQMLTRKKCPSSPVLPCPCRDRLTMVGDMRDATLVHVLMRPHQYTYDATHTQNKKKTKQNKKTENKKSNNNKNPQVSSNFLAFCMWFSTS